MAHRDAQAICDEILQERLPDSPVMLFQPGLSWKRQLRQRPQQLASACARQGALVFYIEPEFQIKQKPISRLTTNLYWCSTPLSIFRRVESPWVYLLTWSIDYTQYLVSPRLIYDIVDDLSAFAGDAREIQANHIRRLQQARIILASSRRLCDQAGEFQQSIYYCPNAVDIDFFQSMANRPVPSRLREIRALNKPVIGYVGAIASWMDFELLEKVIRLRPAYEFVLVGPALGSALSESSLLNLRNLTWIDQQAYENIPGILGQFDVGIIPFSLNNITHSASPIKLFEFFAAGIPVVITPMEECLLYPGVLVGGEPEEFALQIDSGLQRRNDHAYLRTIKNFAGQNTWDQRAGKILSIMDEQESSYSG